MKVNWKKLDWQIAFWVAVIGRLGFFLWATLPLDRLHFLAFWSAWLVLGGLKKVLLDEKPNWK